MKPCFKCMTYEEAKAVQYIADREWWNIKIDALADLTDDYDLKKKKM